VAACSLSLSLWNFFSSRELCKKDSVRTMLADSAAELSKDSERKLRALESEWDVMYAKFGKLAGRMDRERALGSAGPATRPAVDPAAEPPRLTHSDVLRRGRQRE